MSLNTFIDTHSPWYEVFSRTVEPEAEPEPPNLAADEDWVTEAVCGAYND